MGERKKGIGWALLALLVPPLVAGGLGLGSVIVLVMAADAGMRDEATAEKMLWAYMIALGVIGASGLAFAAAALTDEPTAARWHRIGKITVIFGLIAAVVAVVLYFLAVAR